jgi:hypothetical protein
MHVNKAQTTFLSKFRMKLQPCWAKGIEARAAHTLSLGHLIVIIVKVDAQSSSVEVVN